MDKGFLIFAQGEEYIKQAYLAALSITATKNSYRTSIVTSDVKGLLSQGCLFKKHLPEY